MSKLKANKHLEDFKIYYDNFYKFADEKNIEKAIENFEKAVSCLDKIYIKDPCNKGLLEEIGKEYEELDFGVFLLELENDLHYKKKIGLMLKAIACYELLNKSIGDIIHTYQYIAEYYNYLKYKDNAKEYYLKAKEACVKILEKLIEKQELEKKGVILRDYYKYFSFYFYHEFKKENFEYDLMLIFLQESVIDDKEILDYFQNAINKEQNNPKFYEYLAYTYSIIIKHEDCRDKIFENLKKAINLKTNSPEVYINLYCKLWQYSSLDEDSQICMQADGILPTVNKYIFCEKEWLQSRILSNNYLRKAYTYYEKAINLEPNKPEFDEYIYDSCVGDASYLERAISLDPKNPKLYKKLGYHFFDVGDSFFSEKNYNRSIENYDKCIEYYEKAFSLDINNDELLRKTGDRCYEIGNRFKGYAEAQDYYKKAFDYYKKALILKPESYNVYIGDKYFEIEEYGKAIENYEKAIELDSTTYSLYKKLGDSYFNIHCWEEASEIYKKAIEKYPKEFELYKKLGDCFLELENASKTLEFYFQYIEKCLEEDDLEEDEKVSDHYKELADMCEELTHKEKSLSSDGYLFEWEEMELLAEKALKLYKKAADVKPSAYLYKKIGELYGGCYNNIKDYEEAIEAYKKSLKMDPQNKWLKEEIKECRAYSKIKDEEVVEKNYSEEKNLIERLERFEEKLGVSLEKLNWKFDKYNLIITGELHSKQGEELKENIRIIAALYDKNGYVINTIQSDIYSKYDFMGYEPFSITFYSVGTGISKIRVFPKKFTG